MYETLKTIIWNILNMIYPEKRKIKNLIKNYYDIQKIIYLQTPEHGNLGDQAIAIAGKKYLENKFKDKLILEFTLEEYERNGNLIKKLINNKDIIYLHGGGNLGNLYKEIEMQRRKIITSFPENKIVIMPQSISFTDDKEGKKEYLLTQQIYGQHRNLHIMARDEKSYEIGKKLFSNNLVYLTPDIVLFLEDLYINKIKEKREDVIFTLRKDKEKILSDKKIKDIIQILGKNKIKYNIDDTTVDYGVIKETRDFEVEKILTKIGKSKINITDRFHGVIFSVITNTPVIVFKSLDHKIAEGIKWFKNYENIYYLDENESIEKIEEIILKHVTNEMKERKKECYLKTILKNIDF